jgi:uncharacterized delta-60 repeat protein
MYANPSAEHRSIRSATRRRLAAAAAAPLEALEGRLLLANATLDPTFGGGDGRVETDAGVFDAAPERLALQADGKTVVATRDWLVRLTTSGARDAYGDGVTVNLDEQGLSGNTIEAAGNSILLGGGTPVVQPQPGEGTIVGGVVARFTPAGTLDTSFGGGDGKVSIPEVEDGQIVDIELQPDGKILVLGAGTIQEGAVSRGSYIVARLTPSGTLDTSFGGGDGWAEYRAGNGITGSPVAIGVQPGTNGKIVVAGNALFQSGGWVNLQRLNADGAIDTTFGAGGTAEFNTGFPNASVSALGFQSDGTVIVSAGYEGEAPYTDLGQPTSYLLRFSPTGQLDQTTTGPYRLREFTDLQVLPDDKILVAGSSSAGVTPFTYRAMVMRFNANGTIDTSFSDAFLNNSRTGWDTNSRGTDVEVQSDGKILLGGYGNDTPDGPPTNIGVARLVPPTGTQPPPPDTGQTPFTGTPFSVNQIIQAEDFDNGGQGVAYSDRDNINQGGQYRTNVGVDIENSGDTGGGFNIGYARPGEWVEYTINVPTTGAYNIETRLGAVQSGQLSYQVDGQTRAAFSIAPTAGFQSYTTNTQSLGNLTAGTHVLRLTFDATSGERGVANVNWLRIVPAGTTPPPTGETNGLTGTYYNNDNFTGESFTRVDSNINFNWDTGSPDARIAPDTFSIRWTGQIDVPTTGTYTFYIPADDRSRLLIDGQQIINYVPGVSGSTATITLASGRHNITYEYVELTGRARAALEWSGPGFSRQVVPSSRLFTGAAPAEDTQAPSTVPNFEVTRSDFPGVWQYRATWSAATDNVGVVGYRLQYRTNLDGEVQERTVDLGTDQFSFSAAYPSGTIADQFRIAAIDAAGNVGTFVTPETSPQQPRTAGLTGTYYNNDDFTARAFSRNDSTVNFDWAAGSPDPRVAPDTFSVRWTGWIDLGADIYTFKAPADDRAKLTINNQTVVDYIPGQTSSTGTFETVVSGRFPITLESREFGGNARVSLQWNKGPNGSLVVVPSTVLSTEEA